MVRKLCKNTLCIEYAMISKDYCRKHQKELELKSKMYLKEMNNENKKVN